MWKAEAGHKVDVKANYAEDEWETGDVNIVSEKEQRWAGGKALQVDVPLNELVDKVKQKHDTSRIQEYSGNSFARGYGGKYGVQQDPERPQNGGTSYKVESSNAAAVTGNNNNGKK